MNGTPLKKLARDLNLTTDRLTAELDAIGVSVNSEDDIVTGQQQLKLLQSGNLNMVEPKVETKHNLTFDDLENAESLIDLDNMLTTLMTSQKIQPIIKEKKLDELIDIIISMTAQDEKEEWLYAASMLGRLAAVARSREAHVLSRVSEIVEDELPSLDILAKDLWKGGDKDDIGKRRNYAAMSLRLVEQDWVTDYCLREAVNIDTAENARRELLSISLKSFVSVADWLIAISNLGYIVKALEKPETRVLRSRRIYSAILENLLEFKGDIGGKAGDALEACFAEFVRGKFDDVDNDKLFDTVDSALAILVRMIEMRFSHAMDSELYSVVETARKTLGPGLWSRFLSESVVVSNLKILLLEAALVLARQNRTDKKLISIMSACYSSRPQLAAAIKKHLEDIRDLDPDIAEWWRTAGSESKVKRYVEHKVGNNEDSQIGALLIEVDSNREAMDKVGRAVVPLLEISEPVLASTVKKAVEGYKGIAQTARRLARMRKLTKTDMKGERLEYNPREHEMLGGHQAGVRRVKVVRDGIKKEFAGKIKTLVKPWVEPDED